MRSDRSPSRPVTLILLYIVRKLLFALWLARLAFSPPIRTPSELPPPHHEHGGRRSRNSVYALLTASQHRWWQSPGGADLLPGDEWRSSQSTNQLRVTGTTEYPHTHTHTHTQLFGTPASVRLGMRLLMLWVGLMPFLHLNSSLGLTSLLGLKYLL